MARVGANFCRVCGKLLHSVPCSKCNGTGEVKVGSLGKKICQACNGSGKLYVCSDLLQHVKDSLLPHMNSSINLGNRPSAIRTMTSASKAMKKYCSIHKLYYEGSFCPHCAAGYAWMHSPFNPANPTGYYNINSPNYVFKRR